jgi:hypothetical protein
MPTAFAVFVAPLTVNTGPPLSPFPAELSPAMWRASVVNRMGEKPAKMVTPMAMTDKSQRSPENEPDVHTIIPGTEAVRPLICLANAPGSIWPIELTAPL